MMHEQKNLLDSQRKIFESRIRETFSKLDIDRNGVNDIIAELLADLPYPTKKGVDVIPDQLIMTPLTKEQQEYILLKKAMDRMKDHYLHLVKDQKISPCRPANRKYPYNDIHFLAEGLFYEYMAQKENEFAEVE